MSTSRASTISVARAKAANLERIRNNQRRCRARRRAYIAELEEKIRQHESTSTQPPTDPKLQQLVGENDSLKRLLKSLGLGDGFLKAYGRARQIAPEISRAQLSDESCCQSNECSSSSEYLDREQSRPVINHGLQMESSSLPPSIDAEALNHSSLQFFESSIEEDAVLPWDSFDIPGISTFASGSLQPDTQPQGPVQLIGDSLIIEALSSAIPTRHISNNTTLCSLAFSLVLRNNLKGYSAAELDVKLQVGYRNGTATSEGCRVDNKVLFNVLAEIS